MAKIKATFKSGDMVRVKAEALVDSWGDKVDYVQASFHSSKADTEQWHADQQAAVKEAMAKGEDPFHINRQSDGESRLAPLGGSTRLFEGAAYRVLRARCRESFSYSNATGGWTKLLDLNTGREVFYKMHKLEKVVA